jgi:hypothetical protein
MQTIWDTNSIRLIESSVLRAECLGLRDPPVVWSVTAGFS